MQRIKNGTWFRFPEVDIAIPEHLWPKFEEMYPFFLNKEVPKEDGYQTCRAICSTPADKRSKKLVGALSTKKILLYTPLLRWCMDHGAVIKSVPNDRLQAHKSLYLACGAGDRGTPDRRCRQEQSSAQGGVQALAEQQVREFDRKL